MIKTMYGQTIIGEGAYQAILDEASRRIRWSFERHGRLVGDVAEESITIPPHPVHYGYSEEGEALLCARDDRCGIEDHWFIDPGGPAIAYRAEVDTDALCPICGYLDDKPSHLGRCLGQEPS